MLAGEVVAEKDYGCARDLARAEVLAEEDATAAQAPRCPHAIPVAWDAASASMTGTPNGVG